MNSAADGSITEGGVWGGVAAALGAAVRQIQSPSVSRRQFWTTVFTGGFFGILTGFLVIWHYGDTVPPHIAACAAAGVGLSVSELMKILVKLMSRTGDRLITGVEARMDAAGWKSADHAVVKPDAKPVSSHGAPDVPPAAPGQSRPAG